MAGGIDWFRWHHGSVTDPKFQLVAKKAGVRLGDVIAVWAFVLEKASADTDRGTIGQIDFETLDFLLGADEGTTARILDAMTVRGLIAGSRIARWEERQPKREDDTANERKRRQREREHELEMSRTQADASRDVTQESRDVTLGHARGEKRREEEIPLAGFARFWDAWPKSDRKQAKGKCLEAWKKAGAEPHAALIVSHVEGLKSSSGWTKNGGEFIPAPLVYLNKRSWEGAELDSDPYGLKGAL
jgi:hypothetical protein